MSIQIYITSYVEKKHKSSVKKKKNYLFIYQYLFIFNYLRRKSLKREKKQHNFINS